MFPASAEQLSLRRRPTFRQQVCPRRTGSLLQVAKYLLNNYRIFDTSDDLNGTAAFTCLDIDVEDALEALCPGHGRAPFGRPRVLQCIRQFALIALAPLRPCDQRTMRTVRRKHPVETGEIDARFRHQRRQFCNEVQRLEDDMRGAVTIGGFQFLAHLALRRQ